MFMERKKIRQGPPFKKTRGKKNIIYIYIFAYELQEQFICLDG